MFLARVSYRSQQFLGGLVARVEASDRALVEAYLTPESQRLFYGMARRDQRHSLDVFHELRRQGSVGETVLVAALLHDVGKGDVRMWHRALYVLLQAVTPGLLRHFARSNGYGWRNALARMLDHPRRGAVLVASAGLPEAAVELIRCHHEPFVEEESQLELLQRADDRY